MDAAFAVSFKSEKKIKRYPEAIRETRKRFRIGISDTRFPTTDCLRTDTEGFGKLFLRFSAVPS